MACVSLAVLVLLEASASLLVAHAPDRAWPLNRAMFFSSAMGYSHLTTPIIPNYVKTNNTPYPTTLYIGRSSTFDLDPIEWSVETESASLAVAKSHTYTV